MKHMPKIIIDDTKTKADEEYKGTSSTLAYLGGRATTDGIAGSILGAAVGVAAAKYLKKDMTQALTYGSTIGGIVGLFEGGLVDGKRASNAEMQFKENREEIKSLRAENKTFLDLLKSGKTDPADVKATPKTARR